MDIDAKIPLQLHPQLIDQTTWPEGSTAAKAALKCREAMEHMYKAAGAYNDIQVALSAATKPAREGRLQTAAAVLLNGKPTMLSGHEGEAFEIASKANAKVLKIVAEIEKTIRYHHNEIEKAVEAKVNDRANLHSDTTQAEVRAFVRSLPKVQRAAFVRKLAEQGDVKSLNALRSLPLLADIDEGLLPFITDTVKKLSAGPLLEDLHLTTKAVLTFESALKKYFAAYDALERRTKEPERAPVLKAFAKAKEKFA